MFWDFLKKIEANVSFKICIRIWKFLVLNWKIIEYITQTMTIDITSG